MKKLNLLIFLLVFVFQATSPSRLIAQINCSEPTGLSASSITQTSAVLNWSPNAPSTALFNLQYLNPSSNTWITINNVSRPYTLGNLSCGSGYAWKVQRVCSSTNSTTPIVSAWTTSTFSTQGCVTTECVPPLGVAATNITSTSAVLSGASTTLTGLYNLQYHGPNTTNWTTLNNITLPFQLGNLGCGLLYEWRLQRVCSNAAGTTPTLSSWSTVGVFTTAACSIVCEAPAGLTTTNITQTSAVLNFAIPSNTGNVFNLRYRKSNSTTWITVNNVSMPYQLGNLICGSGYIWQSQRVCNSNSIATSYSNWSLFSTFSTQACITSVCESPVGMATTNITQTSAVLNCAITSNAGNVFNLRYRKSNTETWTTLSNVTMPYQLGNLICGSGYLWQSQRVCNTISGATSVSNWSLISNFNTLLCNIACLSPTQLTVYSVTPTSAVLSWEAVSGAVSYIVYHKQANNDSNFIPLTTSTNSINVNGLISGTSYIYKVRAVCAVGTISTSISPFSNNYLFTTSNGLKVYPNPVNEVLTMSMEINEVSKVSIQLRDIYGQIVTSSNETSVKGINEFTINASGINDGVYFLTIKTPTDSVVSKVFIKH